MGNLQLLYERLSRVKNCRNNPFALPAAILDLVDTVGAIVRDHENRLLAMERDAARRAGGIDVVL